MENVITNLLQVFCCRTQVKLIEEYFIGKYIYLMNLLRISRQINPARVHPSHGYSNLGCVRNVKS